MASVTTDVTGILATIDHALGPDWETSTSGDSMRWAPPATAITFAWDENAETGSAMFTDVNVMDAESLQAGDGVWVNGVRYIIVAKSDTDQGLIVELSQ